MNSFPFSGAFICLLATLASYNYALAVNYDKRPSHEDEVNPASSNKSWIQSLQKTNVSSVCTEQLIHFTQNYRHFRTQVDNIKFRLPYYLSRLGNAWPSSFRECLQQKGLLENGKPTGEIEGQFCLAFFLPSFREKMTFEENLLLDGKRPPTYRPITIPQTGICVPSSCSTYDTEKLLASLLLNSASNWTITVPETYCQTRSKAPVPFTTKIFLVFLGLLMMTVVLGTTIDVYERTNLRRQRTENVTQSRITFSNKMKTKTRDKLTVSSLIVKNGESRTTGSNKQWIINVFWSFFKAVHEAYYKSAFSQLAAQSPTRRFFKCFSLYSNVKSLLRMETSPNEFECFNGIRLYVMMGVQTIHVLHLSFPNGWRNLNQGAEWLRSLHYQGTLHLGVFLESSIAISAGLLTMSALRRIREEKEQFNLLSFYARRIWRLVPAYFINLALIVCILPYLGEGPRWPDLLYEVQNCRENGWTNLLFINNLVNSDRMCGIHYWYNAADVQLLLIAPTLILAFHRSARHGIRVCLVFICTSVVWLFYKAYFRGINGRDLHFEQSPMNSVKYLCELYFLPISRLGCYAAGVATGYYAYIKGRNVRINTRLQNVLPALAIAILLSPVWHWYRFETSLIAAPTRFEAAIVESLCRVVWTSAGSYLCLASYARFQDPIVKSFTWLTTFKFQIITARLHYSVYILHFNIDLLFFATRLEPMDFSFSQLLKVIMGLLFVTYMVAIPYTLLAEMPFINLAKMVENRRSGKTSAGDGLQNKHYCDGHDPYDEIKTNHRNTMERRIASAKEMERLLR